MRDENALRDLIEHLGVGKTSADVTIGIPRFVNHIRREIHVTKTDGAVWLKMDLRARHRMTVLVVAAFPRIPGMRQHQCRDYQMFHG